MLRLAVGHEDVHGPTRRAGDALGDRAVPRRGDVRSAHPRVGRAHEGGREVGEPLGVGVGVVVDVGDDLPGGRFQARVAGVGETAILRPDEPAIVAPHHGGRVIRGPIVHDDDLVIRIGEPAQPLEAVPDRATSVVGADHDGDAGPGQARCQRHLGEGLAHRLQRRFGPAVPAREAEVPVVDIGARPVPLVGPGVDERAGAPRRERAAHLPVQRPRLHVLAVPPAVEPDLAHHEGALTRKGLQPREVGAQALLRLEVDVVADEVEEVEPQILGGGIVHVRDQGVGRLALGGVVQPFEVALHRAATEPACNGGRDLVADRVAEDGRMTGRRAHAGADQLFYVGSILLVGEEPDVALHRQADEDSQIVALGGVEQPGRRHAIGPEAVDPVLRHERTVPLDDLGLGNLAAVRTRAKRAVGDAAHVELRIAEEEKLAAHRGRCDGNRDWGNPRRGSIALRRRRRAYGGRAPGAVDGSREAAQQWNASQIGLFRTGACDVTMCLTCERLRAREVAIHMPWWERVWRNCTLPK